MTSMADFTPVGNTGKQQDPFGAINNILGLMGKKQELQSQGLMLQQTQMETRAQKETNDFMGKYNPGKHMDPNDGTSSLDQLTDDADYQKMSGMAQTRVYNHMMQVKQNQLTNLKSLQDMGQSALNYTKQQSGGLRDDPDLLSAATNPDAYTRAQGKIRDLGAHIASMGPNYKPAADWLTKLANNPANLLESGLRSFNVGAESVSEQQPSVAPNAAGVPQLTRRSTGETGPAPLTAGYTPPTVSTVAGTTARTTGAAETDKSLSDNVLAAQKDALANIDTANRIDQLADIVHPGALPAKVRAGLGALGLQSVNQAQSELEKDLGQMRGKLALRAGSDTRAGEALGGLPTATTPTETIHNQMDLQRGYARQDLALGKLRDATSGRTGGQMSGFAGEYSHAVSGASPLIHEYNAKKTPEEQAAFLKRQFKTRAEAQEFLHRHEAVKRHSGNILGE